MLDPLPHGVEKWLQDACSGHSVGLEQLNIEAVFAWYLVILQGFDGSDDLCLLRWSGFNV